MREEQGNGKVESRHFLLRGKTPQLRMGVHGGGGYKRGQYQVKWYGKD